MFRLSRSARDRADAEEREKIARLEEAEREVKHLKARGDRAIQFLESRDNRNHWRESIEQMIRRA